MGDLGVVVTSAGVAAAGNRFSRMLDATGTPLRGGVAVLTGNVPEYLAAYRGTTWSGRRFTPMSWRWTPDEVAYVVENCEAEVLVVEDRFAHLAAEAMDLVGDDRRFAVGGSVSGYRQLVGDRRPVRRRPRRPDGGLDDALHVGHDRPAEGGAAAAA